MMSTMLSPWEILVHICMCMYALIDTLFVRMFMQYRSIWDQEVVSYPKGKVYSQAHKVASQIFSGFA